MYTYVTCRALTIEYIYLGILGVLEFRTNSYTQIYGSDTRQGDDTSLEIVYLSLYLVLKIASQGLIAQSRNKNCPRLHTRIGGNSVGQLINVSEDTCL